MKSLLSKKAPRPGKPFTIVLVTFFLLLSFTGCSDYWWQRGQPPSVSTLLSRSHENFRLAKEKYSASRPDVIQQFSALDSALERLTKLAQQGTPSAQLKAEYDSLEQEFMKLEGKLSLGSRPALGELSGQLRTLAEENARNNRATFSTFGLFAARTRNFLASELSVPAPV